MWFTAALVLSNTAATGVCSGGAVIYGEEGSSGYSDGAHMAADLALLFPKVGQQVLCVFFFEFGAWSLSFVLK